MIRDTKRALLDAAQESFAAKGFGGTSVRGVAAAVGIKESSVYNHFAGKQALFDAVLDRAESRLVEVADRFRVPFDDPGAAAPVYEAIGPGRLTEVADAFLHAWLTDPDVVAARRVLTVEQYRTPAAGERLRRLTVDGPLAFQSDLFARLIHRGAFRPAAPEAVALAFWGPILAILTSADTAGDEAEARRTLHLHLEHFTTTHAMPVTRREETVRTPSPPESASPAVSGPKGEAARSRPTRAQRNAGDEQRLDARGMS